jgi:cysteine desulfuration protein SufE
MSIIQDRITLIVSRYIELKIWEDRYKLLIEDGKKMPLMDEALKIEQNLVKGCQSQVWFSANLQDGKIYFSADSDASIVKGIVAILWFVYNGSTPDEILQTKPDFVEQIGLRQHLSMSRANGLNSMLKQISFYAMAFKVKLAQKST